MGGQGPPGPKDESRPDEGRQIVEQIGEDRISMRRDEDNYQRHMAALDVEYVRQSFRRSWGREVKRLRRSLRGAA